MRNTDTPPMPTMKLTFLKSKLKPFKQNADASFFSSCRSTSRWSISQLLNGTAIAALMIMLVAQLPTRMVFLDAKRGIDEQDLKDELQGVHMSVNAALTMLSPIVIAAGALACSICTRRMQRFESNPDAIDTTMDNPYLSGTCKSIGIAGLTSWAFCTIMTSLNCFDKNDNYLQQATCMRNWLNAELVLWAALFIFGMIITVGSTCHVKNKIEKMDSERAKLLDHDANNNDDSDALLKI